MSNVRELADKSKFFTLTTCCCYSADMDYRAHDLRPGEEVLGVFTHAGLKHPFSGSDLTNEHGEVQHHRHC